MKKIRNTLTGYTVWAMARLFAFVLVWFIVVSRFHLVYSVEGDMSGPLSYGFGVAWLISEVLWLSFWVLRRSKATLKVKTLDEALTDHKAGRA